MRRLISYLHQPETKVSRRGPPPTGVRAVPAAGPRGVVRPYKSAPYMGIGLNRAALDIICVEIHHEEPAELPGSPGDDGVAPWSLRPSVRARSLLPVPWVRDSMNRPRARVLGYTVRVLTS